MATYGVKWSNHPCYKRDPLPDIEPALLNSLDISRYVQEGCLLEKDCFKQELLKTASYEMRFLGTLYDWELKDGKLQRRCREIIEDEDIELSKNSISYLWIKEPLRLPEYIAARFNLRIKEVHKGILLGTGPLVDPGFGGRILIPLHNLTDNDYMLTGGQGIIWVEFTKVSSNPYWKQSQEGIERPSQLVTFPSNKVSDKPDYYLYKSRAIGGVQSAFRGALQKAISATKDASDTTQGIIEKSRKYGAIGLTGIALSIFALLFSAYNIVISAYDISGQVADRVHRQGERIYELEMMVEDLKARLNELDIEERQEAPAANIGESGSPAGEAGLEGDDLLASDRATSSEHGESPAPEVR